MECRQDWEHVFSESWEQQSCLLFCCWLVHRSYRQAQHVWTYFPRSNGRQLQKESNLIFYSWSYSIRVISSHDFSDSALDLSAAITALWRARHFVITRARLSVIRSWGPVTVWLQASEKWKWCHLLLFNIVSSIFLQCLFWSAGGLSQAAKIHLCLR